MMLEVPFTVGNKPPTHHKNQLVSFSIPFAKSMVQSLEYLSVISENNHSIDADFSLISCWPDGSIKWVKCAFLNQISSINTQYTVVLSKELQSKTLTTSITQNKDHIEAKCKTHHFIINKQQLGFDCIPWRIELTTEHEQPLQQKVTDITLPEQQKNYANDISISGCFTNELDELQVNFNAQITLFHHASVAKVSFTLTNPKPMIHHGGKWDLGNENSFIFKACQLNLSSHNSQIKLSSGQSWQPLENQQTLFQASSGGDNWQSNNHVNANNKNALLFKGFQLTQETSVISSGLRAQPSITHIGEQPYTFYLENFWQNFPKSIAKNEHQINIGLFPTEHTELHELQPGEQKTHSFYFSTNANDETISIPTVSANICPKYLATTNTIPFFIANITTDKIDGIIQLGLTDQNNFFEKREQIDEYGWRNFGDIYADHETLEYKGNDELVSHYNNQYDPLYGFIRQYLLTHDEKWWQLAQDLAQHIKDIDIYHTDLDKIEYNHGLFWHTDHYLPAATASHRTYSKHQDANAYQDHAGGGGPGGQHCYTTGLMLHYFLTGDETSKDTVINLAKWISNVYEGSGSVLDNLLKIKNRHIPGYKNVLTEQYPLDRGTGNYIFALIDAYEVSGQQSFLDQASLVIKNTANPYEDLSLRHLNNIEECWFYTVFLQSVGRYLQTKEHIEQFDESFEFAKALLLHFANWMVDYEQPYLTTPEILEYPNDTWAAQDIRKANILYLAYYYENNDNIKNEYQQKAEQLYQYVAEKLSASETKYFSRILSILMQNHGIKTFVQNRNLAHSSSDKLSINHINKPTSLAKQSFKVLSKSLITSSVKNELQWLRKRSKKIDDLLLKVGMK